MEESQRRGREEERKGTILMNIIGSFVRTLMHDQHEGTLSSTAFMDDHLKRQMIDVIVRLSMQYSMESRFTWYPSLPLPPNIPSYHCFIYGLLIDCFFFFSFGEPELIELKQEEQPRYLEMVARLKADNLPRMSLSPLRITIYIIIHLLV